MSASKSSMGYRVVGGGFNAEPIFTFVQFAKAGLNTYGVIGIDDGPDSGNITAQAICASGPGIGATRSVRRAPSAGALQAVIAARLAELRTHVSGSAH